MAQILAAGVGSEVTKRLFGGGARPTQQYSPVGLKAGGFDLTYNPKTGQYGGGSTQERLGYIQNLSDLYKGQAGEIRNLRGLVRPGFSQLRQQRLQGLGDIRTRALGNLRENLAQRRVLGSSFGQAALGRTQAEFAREADRIRAESFMQELDATNKLLGQEYDASRAATQAFIDNLNLEAGMATQLATGATDALQKNAAVQSQILQEQANNALNVGGYLYENPPSSGGGTYTGSGTTTSPGGLTLQY